MNTRAVKRNAVSHFVAKLVKSFGGLRNAVESLDDLRYRKAQFTLSRMRNSVARNGVMAAVRSCGARPADAPIASLGLQRA